VGPLQSIYVFDRDLYEYGFRFMYSVFKFLFDNIVKNFELLIYI